MTSFMHRRFDELPALLHAGLAAQWSELESQLQQRLGKDFAAVSPTLAGVLACSDYLVHWCRRCPDWLVELLGSGDLHQAYASSTMSLHLQDQLRDVATEQDLIRRLRQFRQREMVRIIWRDLAGWSGLEQTMAELSQLADACVEQSLQLLSRWQSVTFGTPVNAEGQAQQLVVIAMGKLGANELNLSSDIDLIFTYPEGGETQGGQRQISNSEYFQKLGQKLISVLAQQTEDGFVFRVDMRLRPFGESGPLVCTFTAMEEYYEIHGREWERYALIKARIIAGDLAAGEELLQTLHPFIYRRYMDYSAYESLREMKAMIQKEVVRKGKEQNIKVGPGGIREIEFIGQVFQLIRGGHEPRLQQRAILAVLQMLQELQLLPDYVVTQLAEAYDFLRRSEHRLQAWRDEQTQLLPADEVGRQRLAFSMGFPDWAHYIKELDHQRGRVQEHFNQVFAAPQSAEQADAGHYALLWQGSLDTPAALERLDELGFADSESVYSKLRGLRQGRAYGHLTAQGRDRMDRLMPLLIGACVSTAQPELALLRSLDVIEAVVRRTVYLLLLIENPMALSQLVRLCAASPWITRYLSQHPMLLDELLDPRSLYDPPDKPELALALHQRLDLLDPEDVEQAMDALRQFKHAQFLRVAAADLAGALPLMKVSDHLSWIAEVVLERTFDLAWHHLVARHGRPICTSDGEICDTGFAVVAYGKLGGLELGYGSDLDLVFLHSGESESLETTGKQPLVLGVFFARLAQRMIHILNSLTPAGVLFEIDTRLRPDGAAGLLVSSLAAFEAYQGEKAWTWEHQALVRARVITGDPAIAQRFEAIRRQILGRQRDPDSLRQEVLAMRARMRTSLDKSKDDRFDLKQGQGGIVDIEFMVQYGVLAFAHAHPALLDYTDNIRILERLAEAGVMRVADAEFLSETYRHYRDRVHRLKLQEQSTLIAAEDFCEQREGVRRIWSAWLEQSQE
ncbi:MAG: bifunctional [glutamate--ammonia ligase]-adenylyl-L-tyrosine phosphorylase/[glutamate--ammonia-ligase] adenylyltransferase [Gammaproteobacteria bacterium]